MSSKEVASALNAASDLAMLVIPAGGPAGVVAGVVAVALKAASAIAAAGGDPVGEITRILSSVPEVNKVHGGWDSVIDNEFADTDKSPPTPAPSARRIVEPAPVGPSHFTEDDPTPPTSPSSEVYPEDDEG